MNDDTSNTPTLIPGSAHFIVTEEPAYELSGNGEHLFVLIEKEDATTDQVAQALAAACGKKIRDVGYAGRKDRHAITRQWFSVHFGKEDDLPSLEKHLKFGRIHIHNVTRHGNKLRLGHLAGNSFSLGIAHAPANLSKSLTTLAHHGILNQFGQQRFGINGSNLAVARAWGNGHYEEAIARIIDPHCQWQWGNALPEGFRHGPDGQILGALRRQVAPEKALIAGGDPFRKFIASAAQSAIFNAVLDARRERNILHTFRVGDIGCTAFGAPFLLTQDDLLTTNERAKLGAFDAFTTGPMPGTQKLRPAEIIDEEERTWSESIQIPWSWFATDGVFASPGERRPLLIAFRTPPKLRSDGDVTWLDMSLPAGSYATTVLEQLEITIPEDRRG